MRFKLLTTRNAALAIVSVLLAMCLAFGIILLPKTALAVDGDEAETTYAHTYILGAEETDVTQNKYNVTDMSKGWNEAVAQEGKVLVRLESDWTAAADENYITSLGSGAGFSFGRILVPENAEVVLDLNGHNIDRKISNVENSTAPLDRVSADEVTDEDLTSRQGNVIHVAGKLEITDNKQTGGKICGGYGSFLISGNKNEYSQRGGGVSVVENGELILSGNAVISDNIARWGGGVYVEPYAKFTMNGGVIESNSSTQGGGGVLVSGTFEMKGGSITGNTATDNNGGGVYVNTMPNKEFLHEGEPLPCIFTMTGGTITGNTTNSHGGGVCNANEFTMTNGTITGNTAAKNGGGVYNTGDFTLDENGTIEGNIAKTNGGGVYNFTNGTFEMKGGTITGNTATDNNGGGVCNTDEFTITGGTICDNTANTHGGGVYNTGDFTLDKNGAIEGNIAKTNGGGVYNTGSFTLEGGTIGTLSIDGSTNRNTATNGGGVYNTGTLKVNGGSITGSTATNGGGVYNYTNGTIEMTDGNITGNTATNNGGGIYNYTNCTLEVTDGNVTGNTANNGGGIYNSGKFKVTDGAITGNTANTNGGGVYNSKTFTFEGGIIGTISDTISADGSATGNTAKNGGGVHNSGTFTMEGGSITGNTATTHGGGVYCIGTFTMENGSITGNTANSHGGGVHNTGSFTMNAGSITGGNTAASNGGGVFNNCILKVNGGSITENTARNGGGVYNSNSNNIVNLSGTAVIQNNELTTNDKTSNLQLQVGQQLTVGELTENAHIGIKLSNTTTCIDAGLSTSDVNFASLKYLHSDDATDTNQYAPALNADGQLIFTIQSANWELRINGEKIDTDVPGIRYTYGDYGKDNVISIQYGDNAVTLYKVVSGEESEELTGSYELTAGTYYALSNSLRFYIIIDKLELAEENLTISNLPADGDKYQYTGEAQTFLPEISITLENGETVVPNYSISYSNNLNVGFATLTLNILDSDNYCGYTITRTFEIIPSETAYTIVWRHLGEDIDGNELSVTFNNSDHFSEISAKLIADDGTEIVVDGSSAGLSLTGKGILTAGDYTVSIEGIGNYTLPANSQLTVTVNPLDISELLNKDSFTGEDAQTRRLWLLNIGGTTSQLRSSATYFADGQVITGTEEYYYARYRENEDLSILLNGAYSVTFGDYTFTIAQLLNLGITVNYNKNEVNCSETSGIYENKLNEIETKVTLSFSGSFSGNDIEITKHWAVVTINNGLLNGDGEEYSIGDFTWGEAGITEAPIPEHGDSAHFALQFIKGEETTDIPEFTVYYADGAENGIEGDGVEDDELTFAEFVNSIINVYGCGTYRLTVSIDGTDDGEYYPVSRTFRFEVNAYVLTDEDISLSASSFSYNGNAHRPNVVAPQYATYNSEYYDNVNAGTATVIVTGTGNYAGSVTLTFEITKAVNNVWVGSLEVKGWTYGNYSTNEVYFNVAATYGSADVIYTVTDKNGAQVTNLAAANAGTYTVTATIIGTDNYSAPQSSISNTLVIAEADNGWAVLPSVIAWSYKGYNPKTNLILGTPEFGTVSYVIEDKDGEALTAEFTLADGAVPNVVKDLFETLAYGKYYLVATVSSTGNYGALNEKVEFNIAQAANDWKTPFDVISWAYGSYDSDTNLILGTAEHGEVSFSVLKDGKAIEGLESFKEVNGAIAGILGGLPAGTYTVTAKVLADGNYTAVADGSVTLTIAQAVNAWAETPSIITWVKGEYDAEENVITASDVFGSLVDYEIYETENEENVIYKVANGEVVIDKLAEAGVGHYTLKAVVNATANYGGLEKTFTFQIFAPEGLAWWAWLLIIVGILGVIALVFFILHEKGVLQMLTGRFVIAMRTKMSVDATIAAVRAHKRAEAAKVSVAEAEAREKRQAFKDATPEEKTAILEQKAQEAQALVEKIQGKIAQVKPQNTVDEASDKEDKGE